jgi:threonine aldolase
MVHVREVEDGGSTVIITTGTASNQVVLETIKKKGGELTCSYQEEKEAFLEAMADEMDESEPEILRH